MQPVCAGNESRLSVTACAGSGWFSVLHPPADACSEMIDVTHFSCQLIGVRSPNCFQQCWKPDSRWRCVRFGHLSLPGESRRARKLYLYQQWCCFTTSSNSCFHWFNSATVRIWYPRPEEEPQAAKPVTHKLTLWTEQLKNWMTKLVKRIVSVSEFDPFGLIVFEKSRRSTFRSAACWTVSKPVDCYGPNNAD